MGRPRLQVRYRELTMGAQQVVARVTHADEEIEAAIRRPVRLTPNGYAGVVYGGAVYLLREGNKVDIAESSWEIEDCNRFLMPNSAIPYAPSSIGFPSEPNFPGIRGDWSVESTDFGHYLLFNSSEAEASKIVVGLESKGITVQRWDVSHRPASDGKFYDWFARLRFVGSHDRALELVADALTPPEPSIEDGSPTTVAANPTPPAESLDTRIEDLVNANAALSQRLESSINEIQSLHRRLTSTEDRESSLLVAFERMREHQKSIQAEVTELSQSSALGLDARELLTKRSDAEELLELALAENTELNQEVSSLRGQLLTSADQSRVLTETVQELQQRLAEVTTLERERHKVSAARNTRRRGVAGFLDSTFARIDFVLDSQEVLAALDSPAAIMRCLVQVDMGVNIGSGLAGLPGWREVTRLATGLSGSEDMGRVYYKPDGGRVIVSVHVKRDEKEQRRHIELLRSLG